MSAERVPAHTIVVGVDGSANAARAVAWAAEQAAVEGRDLTVVTAIAAVGTPGLFWVEQAGLDSAAVMDALHETAERQLAEAAEQARASAAGLVVRGVVAEKDPRDALLELATEAAMVVVGSRGRGPVASLLLGSVAHAVARDARCPVVVVRPEPESAEGAEGPEGPEVPAERHGVLVGVGRRGLSAASLAFAYRQASLRAEPLRVVPCIWDARASSGPVRPDEEGYDAERLLLAETVAGMAEHYPDVVVETALERGMVDRTLVRLGARAALVVVGSPRRGAVSGLVSGLIRGRTASVVAEHSSGVVAIVPEPDPPARTVF